VVRWNALTPCSATLIITHFISLPSPNTFPSFQPTITRRTNGHCLGTFISENISVSLFKCSVSRYSPSTFSSVSFTLIRLQMVNAHLSTVLSTERAPHTLPTLDTK
jgi:hypothetical protein